MASQPPGQVTIGTMWWAARHPPVDPQASFAGRNILITGATAGLGFEAALKFARQGASKLIFGARSQQRGEDAKLRICQQTGFKAENIAIYLLDMADFSSVTAFSESVSKYETSIDTVVLNAGIAAPSYQQGSDGFELSLKVNVLSTALLACLLLPKLRQHKQATGRPAYLELMSSSAHTSLQAKDLAVGSGERIIDLVNSKAFFKIERQYSVLKLFDMYIQSGLVNAMRSRSNHRFGTSEPEPELDSDVDVIVTTVCPGLCRTSLGREFPLLIKIPTYLMQLFVARSAEEGARTMVSAVTLGPNSNDQFWSNDVSCPKGDLLITDEGKALGTKVWQEILDILKTNVPGFDPEMSLG